MKREQASFLRLCLHVKSILFHVPPATFSLVNVLSDATIMINRSWNLSIVPVRHLMSTLQSFSVPVPSPKQHHAALTLEVSPL